MMTKDEAEKLSGMAINDIKSLGRKFKEGAHEEITKAFWHGLDSDDIAKVVDTFVVPEGIETPWGIRVVP